MIYALRIKCKDIQMDPLDMSDDQTSVSANNQTKTFLITLSHLL